jgi:hypothetical protein
LSAIIFLSDFGQNNKNIGTKGVERKIFFSLKRTIIDKKTLEVFV